MCASYTPLGQGQTCGQITQGVLEKEICKNDYFCAKDKSVLAMTSVIILQCIMYHEQIN